jgi:hypothetical protein
MREGIGVIEPYVSDKCCTKCQERKPLTAFHRDKRLADGRHYFCKKCRLDHANQITAEGLRSDYTPKREPKEKPTAWKVPADDRPSRERLLDAALTNFREAQPAANLCWSLGNSTVNIGEAA